jgi:hypothetical protein
VLRQLEDLHVADLVETVGVKVPDDPNDVAKDPIHVPPGMRLEVSHANGRAATREGELDAVDAQEGVEAVRARRLRRSTAGDAAGEGRRVRGARTRERRRAERALCDASARTAHEDPVVVGRRRLVVGGEPHSEADIRMHQPIRAEEHRQNEQGTKVLRTRHETHITVYEPAVNIWGATLWRRAPRGCRVL